MEPGDEAKHDQDEHEAGEIEGAHQLPQREQRTDAVLADGERHRPERANRRDLHDDADDRKEHVRDLLDEVEHERAAAAELVQAEAEQHGEQQYLQNLAFRERIDHGIRDHVEKKLRGALHLSGLGICSHGLRIERRRIDVHPRARLDDVDDRQAHEQRDGADDLEIQQRVASGLADLLHILHAGDADHHRAEDDRRNDHLDQLDEAVPERLHRSAGLGIEMSQKDADHDGDDDLKIQRLVERLACRSHVYPPHSMLRRYFGLVTRRRLPAPGGRRDRSFPALEIRGTAARRRAVALRPWRLLFLLCGWQIGAHPFEQLGRHAHRFAQGGMRMYGLAA